MKINLDTKALERLIGGDSELEMELRQSVVENFADRHIKTLLHSEATKRINNEIYKQVNEYKEQTRKIVKEELLNNPTIRDTSVLNQSTKDAIKKIVQDEVEEIIRNEISKVRESINDRVEAIKKQMISECLDHLKSTVRDEVISQAKAMINTTIRNIVDSTIIKKQ